MIKKFSNRVFELYQKAYKAMFVPRPYYNYYYSDFIPKNIIQVKSFDDFEEKIKDVKKSIMINIYSYGYEPNDYMDPLLDELADKTGKYKYFKVQFERQQNVRILMKYNVETPATVIILKGDKQTYRHQGQLTQEEIRQLMK